MATIVLFRDDLRVTDNPALSEASHPIIPVFIHATYPLGKNSQLWLNSSLHQLNQALDHRLIVLQSNDDLFPLIKKYSVTQVLWNRVYNTDQIQKDTLLKKQLIELNIDARSFNANLLFEPWTVLKPDNTFYAVYTPFYKKCILSQPRPLCTQPVCHYVDHHEAQHLPENNNMWAIGEDNAMHKLMTFIDQNLNHYKQYRDIPIKAQTSLLSPHLRFGEISPHQIWHSISTIIGQYGDKDIECFQKELIWREFSYYQLYHFPKLPEKNWQSKFDRFPWKNDADKLKAWQQGETGIPIIDAGMKELITTGYMHNRVRLITGSFLTKNLGIHWKEGEKWFWEHLIDADYASNNANWQWIAGTGFDAAPYFRIFNPILQSQKFDSDGTYIKKHLPQLSGLTTPYLFSPETAPKAVLEKANITIGKDYPMPIVDLKESRHQALAAFQEIKD